MVMRIVRPLRAPRALSDAAVLDAINDTTAEAAIFAKRNHPGWKNRTGTAEGSIRMEPARQVTATRFRGGFGSFDVSYFIFLELGTRFIGADHTLRRAADAVFPSLGRRLRGPRAG